MTTLRGHAGCLNRLSIVCFLALHALSASALSPDKSLTQFSCRTWSVQNGFAADGVTSIAQSKDGFIWIGTRKGLVRYDGIEFKKFPLPETRAFPYRSISALAGLEDGGLWFGIQNGAFGCYHADSGFSAVTNDSRIEPGMSVFALGQGADGSLWVGSRLPVVRQLKDGSMESFPEVTGCLSILEDAHKRIWLGTSQAGLYCWQAGRLDRITNAPLTNEILTALTQDSAGRIWMGTQFGLRCYDPAGRQLDLPPLLTGITKLLRDSQGVIWIGTADGLYRFKDGSLASLHKSDGLEDDLITALLEDQEGNLWVGGRNGVSLLSDVKFPVFSQAEGLQKGWYLAVCPASKGGLWAASSAGISRFDAKTVTNYSTEAGLSTGWIKRVREARNGDLYLLNGNREIEIFREGKIVARHSRNQEWPTALAEDSAGMVVSFASELFRVDEHGMTPYAFGTNGAPGFHWIANLAGARDSSILVAADTGVYRIKGADWQRLGSEDDLASKALWVCEDQEGIIWAGLASGLARIEGARARVWTREDGLFDNFIRAVIPDRHNRLWIHSSQGIFSVDRTQLGRAANENGGRAECAIYDGLAAVKTTDSREVEYSGCETSDGQIWFPSPQGLVMIDPDNLSTSRNLPVVHIETVRVNGREYVHATKLVIPPGKGELEVQYTAPTFIAPERQEFRYKLEGYDSDWNAAGTRRSAFFANLKPGKYRFLVEAWDAGRAGVGNSFEVELQPFFYQTRWFYFLCGAVGAAGLTAAYGWRVSALKREQRALEATQERLESEVHARTAELKERTLSLEREIEERKQMQLEIERVHRKLLEASRQAGMAQVASEVLHNVGNVLNSVNVSANLLLERIRHSSGAAVGGVISLLNGRDAELGDVVSQYPKIRKLALYLAGLSEQLAREQKDAITELTALHKNINHIKEIISMQQCNARVGTVITNENVLELIEDALQINEAALERHGVQIIRDFTADLPQVTVDRHKVLQILLNLISNAKYACHDSGRGEKQITLRVTDAGGRIQITVRDNGVGIPPENITRIFNHGFTTRKSGHGFGLHSAALAAREMGGELRVESDGPGTGACFTLDLPCPGASRNGRHNGEVAGSEPARQSSIFA